MFLKYWQADHLNDLCLQLQKKIITCQKGNNYRASVPELSPCKLTRILHNKTVFSSLNSFSYFIRFPLRHSSNYLDSFIEVILALVMLVLSICETYFYGKLLIVIKTFGVLDISFLKYVH